MKVLVHRWGLVAFTLIALLVVVAIIAILAGMLLPALGKAKAKGQGIACVGNLKQLQLAWQMYVDDRENVMPPNNCAHNGSIWRNMPPSWVLGNAQVDAAITNIESGVLYPCTASAGIYRCPADRALVRASGVAAQPRIRSYSIQGQLNPLGGYVPAPPFLLYRKLSDIPLPELSRLWVFVDVNDASIDSGDFGFVMGRNWGHLPADRHGGAGSLSLADGHAKSWKWRWRKAGRSFNDAVRNEADRQDFARMWDGRPRQSECPPP